MEGTDMPGHDIVTIGASAGGVEAVSKLLARLPADLPASLFVVIHIPAARRSALPRVFSRAGSLPAEHPQDGEEIQLGKVYVAPPDHHLWLEKKRVRVTKGPLINRHRPAIDPLFDSAAHVFGERTVGIVLTGLLDDGAMGLQAIKECGGIAVVQDPAEAVLSSMPESALRNVKVDHCLPVSEIGGLITKLAQREVRNLKVRCSQPIKFKPDNPVMTVAEMQAKYGAPSVSVCPECSGPMWEMRSGKVTSFRCLVGHSFSPESLLAEEAEAVERALWVAVQTLQERANLLRNLAESYERTEARAGFESRAREAEADAQVIQDLLARVTK